MDELKRELLSCPELYRMFEDASRSRAPATPEPCLYLTLAVRGLVLRGVAHCDPELRKLV